MSQTNCRSRHKCADGGEGECTQFQGHYGRHVCSSCLTLFGSGESIPPEPSQGQVEPGAIRTRDEGDGVTHWHCAHCGTQIPLFSSVCGFCKYKICNSCGEGNCPKPSSVRTRDEGDGVTHWHCAHCGTQIPLFSSVCGFCKYKICNSCGEGNCPKTSSVRTRDEGDGVDHWHCAHCGVRIPLNSPVCRECGFKVCSNCVGNEDCWRIKVLRPRDAGDGVDHWHCAHCGTKIPLNSPVCTECGFKLCSNCVGSEDCCRIKAVRPQDAGDGVDHWHCAHCGKKIALGSSVCSLCGYKICNGCSEARCPKTMGGARPTEEL
jgi:predicted nucleic acid-binding Zn ribbon protein